MGLQVNYTPTLRETGAGVRATTGSTFFSHVQHGERPLDMGFLHRHDDQMIHLTESLLVRLRLKRPGGDTVNILCTSDDIGYSRLRLHMPCSLGFSAGKLLDMELFLNRDDQPTTVQGTIHRVCKSEDQDSLRYAVEVDFQHLSPYTEKEIAAFVHASQVTEHPHLLT